MWDLPGESDSARNIWKHYFTNLSAIIFVIDSSDTAENFEMAKSELLKMINKAEFK